jgi:hypothetical protein
MSRSKKVALAFIALLFIWELLNMTGLSLGSTVIVVSAFIDEPIDVVFALIFAATIFLFIWRERVGKWAVFTFIAAFLSYQASIYFRKDFSGYYAFFAKENTHRLFPESAQFLVKDTYHLVMDLLILAAFVSMVVFLILSKRVNGKAGHKKPD